MSIRTLVFAAPLLVAAPAFAQTDSQDRLQRDFVGPVMERADKALAVPEPDPAPPPECAEDSDETVIVVCAPVEDDPERYRVSSRLEEGDDSHLSWSGEAPDVAGPGIFKGPATASGCIKGVTCPPPPAYIIDFSALPEAPPGSDADRIGRGLAPRGSRYDGGEAAAKAQVAAENGASPEGGEPDREPDE